MILLVACEHDITNEIDILHQLFDAGLTCFHLRKPHKTAKQIKTYLNQIAAEYHHHIVLHQEHHLTENFDVKGIHLPEYTRLQLKEQLPSYVTKFQLNGLTVSSSFHHPNAIEQCNVSFDYHLLSPIFDSISKTNYFGKGFSVNTINKVVIGLGGITASNLIELKQKGFQGAAVLGSVWNATDKVKAFKALTTQSVF